MDTYFSIERPRTQRRVQALSFGCSPENPDNTDALQAAFEGNEATLERLDGWLDRLMEEYNSAEQDKDFNPANWMDIPASWWKTPAGGTDTGDNITGSDLRTFRGLPASMQSAVQRGAAAGVAGIQVRLDGRAVGEMVAPYVSTIIARDIG